MKIGIIVHSQTGNTYSVAQKLKDRFLGLRHFVSCEKVSAENDEQPDITKVKLTSVPGTDGYDVLVFGAPVRAFSLSPAMTAYLSQTEVMTGRRVLCYVTQQLPYPWMGGNRAIKQMKALLEGKGAIVLGSGIVNWSSRNRAYMIESLVAKMTELI